MLPPMIIFDGVREKKFSVPGTVIAVQKSGWMDESKMEEFINKIIIPYVSEQLEELEGLGVDDIRPVFFSDAFKAHWTEKISGKFATEGIIHAKIPPGCTSRAQPLDVSINKPFKQVLRALWCDYMELEMEKMHESGDITGNIRPPSNEDVANWVVKACDSLNRNPELIKKSFDVTGISLKSEKISDENLKNAMSDCASRLKEQFGENFDQDNFEFGITNDLYSYLDDENPFSDPEPESEEDDSDEFEF